MSQVRVRQLLVYRLWGLLPPNGKIDQGKITLLSKKNEELDILELSESKFNKVRGNDVSMIFQEPMTCLNPTMTIGSQNKGSHFKS